MRINRNHIRKTLILILPFLVVVLLILSAYTVTGIDSEFTADEDFAPAAKEIFGQEKVAAPVFSQNSGFYDEDFELTMEAAKGCTIYYTLDSSTPTTKSSQYTKALTISDASYDENVYSMRTDFVPYVNAPIFPGQKQVINGYYCAYSRPDITVDKCTVVRAVAVDKEGNVSDVTTASYFVGFQNKEGYDDVAVISLVSDPDGLFGKENGIMVNGSRYEEKMAEADDKTNMLNINVARNYTNSYTLRGKDSEREAHIDYFDKGNSACNFSQEIGMRLHGNASRVNQTMKSLNLYARKEYDGNNTFGTSFFEDGILSDTVTLMRGNDIRGYYLSDQFNGRTMDAQQYRLVQVFLDGEYWGFYAIQERYSGEEYMKAHYDLDDGEYSLFTGKPTGLQCKAGDSELIKTSYQQIRNYVKSHDMSDDKEYQKVCSMIDIQSFIDYYAGKIYTGDIDWCWFKNIYLLYSDNKWHWINYDLGYGASFRETTQYDRDTFTQTRFYPDQSLDNDPFFPYLMKNESFRRDFVNTMLDLSNDTLSPAKVSKDMDQYTESLWDETIKAVARHPIIGESLTKDIETHQSFYTTEYSVIKTYFVNRPKYIIPYMKDYFGLTGSLAKVTIVNENVEGGSVSINTITPALSESGSWTGSYLTDIPVTVKAEAQEGYSFVGWKCRGGKVVDNKSTVSQVKFSGDVKITAVFEKKTEQK